MCRTVQTARSISKSRKSVKMDFQNEMSCLSSLLNDADTQSSAIIRIYFNIAKCPDVPNTVVSFLNDSATKLLQSEVAAILKKHRLEAFSYILVANNLLDLEDLKDDLLNGDVLEGSISSNSMRKLKVELNIGPQQQAQEKIPSLPTQTQTLFSGSAINQNQEVAAPENNRLAIEIFKKCTRMKFVNGMKLYNLPIKEMLTFQGASSILKRFSFGEPSKVTVNETKTILLMGATGSGKTTMINAMINYVLGVEWDDPFRFILVDEEVRSQAFSQTRGITAYDIHYRDGFRIPYSLTIVDTPGFGDTEGLERDKEITLAVKKFFEHDSGIQELNAVGFVVQSSLARLTSSQVYIFNSVLSIFGKDIKDNIRFLATFDNGGQPLVLGAIKEAKLPCVMDSKGLPCHQSFNSIAIFADPAAKDRRSIIEWEEGMENFKLFFKALSNMSAKSLHMTKEVLMNRECLRNTIVVLKSAIDTHLIKMEELRKTKEEINRHKELVDANKNFEMEVDVVNKKKMSVDEQTAMNCLKCEITCHYPCNPNLAIGWCPAFWSNPTGASIIGLAFDALKAVTSSNPPCKICPKNCPSKFHKNEDAKYVHVQEKETRTLFEVRQKYEEAMKKKMTAEELMDALGNDVDNVKHDIIKAIQTITECSNKLKENALRGDPLSTPEYIQIMIENEENEKKSGYMERIANLKNLLKDAEIVKDPKKFAFKSTSTGH